MHDLHRSPETPRRPAENEWRRDSAARKIAGVCAGLAEAFGVSVTLVRAAFVLLALPPFSGIGIVLYLALWFLMPAEDGPLGSRPRGRDRDAPRVRPAAPPAHERVPLEELEPDDTY